MSQNPDQRDKAIARLAAETLRSSGAAADTSCPDMEVLAAYAERGLEPNEAAHWERHFSDCGRCRKMLALLAVSAEAVAHDEAQLRNLRADTTAAPSTVQAQQPVARPRHSALRWLVPALGVAAAVALWFALRPLPPTTQTVAELQKVVPSPTPRPAPAVPPAASGTNSPATKSPAVNSRATDSEVAQAEPAPPPPTAASAASAKQIVPHSGLNELKKDQEEPPAQATPSAAPLAESSSDSVSTSAEARPAAPAPQAPVSTQQSLVTVTTEVPVLETEKTSQPGAPSANAAPSNLASSQLAAQGNLPLSSRRVANSFAKTPGGLAAFGAPGGTLWRASAGGRIERSADRGRSWQLQTSGVTADLLAGAAVSSQVAWIAGRAGVILRTTDGATWQRIAPPMGPTLDWTSIEASDAQHATIASADQRRFSTADGGRTWTPR